MVGSMEEPEHNRSSQISVENRWRKARSWSVRIVVGIIGGSFRDRKRGWKRPDIEDAA
jgi:hypothetical protein